MTRFLHALLFLVACCVLGCGSGDEPKRLRISGEAKFDGQPIPFGDVVFTPDSAKKNFGAQGIATIRNGRYDTAASAGKGFAGGPTIVRVTGLTGEGGKVICEYEYAVDLPTTDGTHEITVPKSAAPKKAGGGGGDI